MLGNASVVSMFTVLAQVFAFLRTAIMAFLFGASGVVDAYNLALVAPVLLAGVIGGWLQAGFVGRYMESCQKPDALRAKVFRSSVAQLVLGISVLVALALFIGRQGLAGILVPDTSEAVRKLTEAAIAIAAWSVIPTALGDFLGLVLNCHGRFVAAAAAPIVNASISAIALWFWPIHDIDALLSTLILGWLAQLGVLVLACRRAEVDFCLHVPGVRGDVAATLRVALPVLPAVVFSNGTTVVMQMAFARMGDGAVAIYGYASRLHGALTQVMIIGIGTVLLPHLAGMVAARQRSEIICLFWRIGRATLLVSLLVLAGVVLLGQATVQTILGRGEFDKVLSGDVARAWSVLTLSLFPFALATFFAKLFQAMQTAILLSLSSLVSLIVTVVVCYAASTGGRLDGVLLAPFAAQLMVLVYFLICFRARFGVHGLFPDWGRAIVMCLAVVVPSVGFDLIMTEYLVADGGVILLALRVGAFAGLFLIVSKLVGAPEWILRKDMR